MRTSGDGWALRSGIVVGLIAAIVSLFAFPVEGGSGTLGLDLTMASMPTGELDVTPVGPFLRGAGLAPGDDAADGTLHVRNQTGVDLSVGINVLPSTAYSDDIVRFTATHDGGVVMRGTIGDLRGMHPDVVRLRSGETADLKVVAEVVSGSQDHRGRVEDVIFELHSEVE
ncbi:MAG: hypothetical protein ACRDLB_14580 [Actinomycetota bacterium]